MTFDLIDRGLDEGSAEQLGASLAQASPHLRQCVASCKHIAESAKQNNDFQSVNTRAPPSSRHPHDAEMTHLQYMVQPQLTP